MVWRDSYAEVEAQFACAHDETAVRRYTASNGVEHIRVQCLGCGDRVRDIKRAELTARQLAECEPWDEALRQAFQERKRAAFVARGAEARQVVGEGRREEYELYLSSLAWRERRQRVLQRAHWQCEGCGEARAEQVHHLTYERFGCEMLFDLVAICRPCHEAVRGRALGAEGGDIPGQPAAAEPSQTPPAHPDPLANDELPF